MKNKGRTVRLGTVYPNRSGAQAYDGQEFWEDCAGAEQYEGGQEFLEGFGARAERPKLYHSQMMGQELPTDALRKREMVREQSSQNLKVSPYGDVVDQEPFSIISIAGAPGAFTLSANTASTRTNIGTYQIPTGYRFVFDPSDVYQEVIFTPYTSVGTNDTNFIIGDFEVVLESATQGKAWRISHGSTIWMRPGSNVSSVGHLRKWQQKYVGVPGDNVQFYFTAGTVLSTANSVLDARCKAGRVVA